MYKRMGFEGEWKLHHQRGSTGNNERDYLATDKCEYTVLVKQAVAWNPSITGTKSEDTILVKETGYEILTKTSEWLTMQVDFGGESIECPDILIIK